MSSSAHSRRPSFMSSNAFGGSSSSARGGKGQLKSCEKTIPVKLTEEEILASNTKPIRETKSGKGALSVVEEPIAVVTIEKKPKRVVAKKTISESAPVESASSSSMDIESI